MLVLIHSDKILQLLNVHLINIIYYKDKMFLVLTIKNSSNFDYYYLYIIKYHSENILYKLQLLWILKN
ncbi:hypothetical protein CHA01nite_15850 [Chryseobacterium hagamense]|uniref:Uncharacterized protein n=1 Tax=Chryseobacterium hagamense TaxID=395935 RepID=A0A511YKX5_9FLAO|nr:hypothetical protein CHA01nite_15850 [Chryseobacterium hagamense]